jgi:hypothetical protein
MSDLERPIAGPAPEDLSHVLNISGASCRREGPGGRRRQRDEVAIGIAHLRQR